MVARGAARALDILEAFEKLGRPSRLTELSNLTGIPVSTCHGLISTMKARGYLQVVRGEIYPTTRIARLASAMPHSARVVDLVRPLLLRLRDATGETAIAATLVGSYVVRLAVVESMAAVRFVASPGSSIRAESCAAGLALLAAGEDLRREPRDEAPRVHSMSWRSGRDESDVGTMGVAIRMRGEFVGIELAGPVERMHASLAAHLEAAAKDLDGPSTAGCAAA